MWKLFIFQGKMKKIKEKKIFQCNSPKKWEKKNFNVALKKLKKHWIPLEFVCFRKFLRNKIFSENIFHFLTFINKRKKFSIYDLEIQKKNFLTFHFSENLKRNTMSTYSIEFSRQLKKRKLLTIIDIFVLFL